MRIITDNEQLLAVLPNVVVPVEGEQPLMDKVAGELELSEQWLIDLVLGEETLARALACLPDRQAEPGSQTLSLAAKAVAAEALARAVPSLDLILTPNGFGVVSNSNVAPASKERVERLVTSLLAMRDRALDALLRVLPQDERWLATRQGQWLCSSLLSRLMDDTEGGRKAVEGITDRWDAFLELREMARPIEQAIAERWLGQELMARLMKSTATGEGSDTGALARTVRSLVLKELNGGKRAVKDLDRVVDYVRDKPDLYPEWQADKVAELFEDKWKFENKKQSPGYFF